MKCSRSKSRKEHLLSHRLIRFFPQKTIHVVVVDPGVGSARRADSGGGGRTVLHRSGQWRAGDGVFEAWHKVREITAEKYFLHPVSHTFHGRDMFAPSAAHLAKGARPSSFGKLIDDYLKPAFTEPQRTSKRQWSGTVLHIDRFGNLITNFHIDEFRDDPRASRSSSRSEPSI